MADEHTLDQRKYRSHLLDIVQAWLPVLTVVIGAIWGLYTYIASQKAAEELRVQQAAAAETERLARQESAEQQRLAQTERDANTRRIEAQKPFLTKQLELYFETANVVGRLVTLPRPARNADSKPAPGAYDDTKMRFYALYWSELSMVEHSIVEGAMAEFKEAFERYESDGTDASKDAMQVAAYRLAHAIRDAIAIAWSGGDDQAKKTPRKPVR